MQRPVLCFCLSSNACMFFASQCHVCRNEATFNNSFACTLCTSPVPCLEHCCHIAQSCVPLSMQFSSWSIYCTLMTSSGQKNTMQNLFFFFISYKIQSVIANSWSVEGWGSVMKRSESGVEGSPDWLRTSIWSHKQLFSYSENPISQTIK